MDFSNFLHVVWPYVAKILVGFILPLLVTSNKPVGAVRLINWAKAKLKVKGGAAVWLTVGVSLLISSLIALADGVFNITGGVTPDLVLGIVISVAGGTQLWYKLLPKPGETANPE